MAMMTTFKRTVENAFNAAAKSYDELRASVPDYVRRSARSAFLSSNWARN
jgi:hypothetical protein